MSSSDSEPSDSETVEIVLSDSEPSTVELTLSDISSTDSGVYWNETFIPEATSSEPEESATNCYKVDGSVYRMPNGKDMEVVKEYVFYTAYSPTRYPASASLCQSQNRCQISWNSHQLLVEGM